MIIVGAGMAGLLAARMLAHHKPVVLERQCSLPNNHSAVLRFRTSAVGDVLNIPFRRVSMIKDTIPWQNPVADALAYSRKNTEVYRSDRSAAQGMVAEPRFIAPSDLITRMADGANIEFNKSVSLDQLANSVRGMPGPACAVITTIPMPIAISQLGYQCPEQFQYKGGSTIQAKIKGCDAYVSLTVPGPKYQFSRVSLTGDQMIIEFPALAPDKINDNEAVGLAAQLLGISDADIISWSEAKYATYQKLLPIADDERKQFIHWATDQHSIYSLGRFATWRPGLLLDDLVKDIRLIDGWVARRSRYDVARHRSQ